jgi:uncharacterized SAM-binding protein YcdF (DUF218 family)
LAPIDRIAGIVALGGGFERTREAVRLARIYPSARLVITGDNPVDYDYARKESGEPSRVILEPSSKSTFENALFTKRLVAPHAGERWLLVTSATHMPRAMATFAGIGFVVEPWPVHDLEPGDNGASRIVTHELLGLLEYRLLGRTKELWPRPKV